MDEIVDIIKNGGIGVLPTDTLYGMVASALNPEAVEKIYLIRKRNLSKPLIVLIGDIEDLKIFNVSSDQITLEILNKIWPGPVSVEIDVFDTAFDHLTRGIGHFAVRLPAHPELRDLISKTGPLVAPSVNREGERFAETIEEARGYFPELDFYVDKGLLSGQPSTVIFIRNGKVIIDRQGQGQIPVELL